MYQHPPSKYLWLYPVNFAPNCPVFRKPLGQCHDEHFCFCAYCALTIVCFIVKGTPACRCRLQSVGCSQKIRNVWHDAVPCKGNTSAYRHRGKSNVNCLPPAVSFEIYTVHTCMICARWNWNSNLINLLGK